MPHQRMTNQAGINLAIAVWLAYDDYDYVDKPNYISVTTLLKPLRQIILPGRIPAEDKVPDIVDRIQARMGQALHSDVENVWKNHYRVALGNLGYPKAVINMVRINPEVEEPDTLPIYTEIRTEREYMGFTIGGKLDLVLEGRLQDVKKTTVWGYTAKKNVEGSWRLQGSLYRWLNPAIVKHDEMFIQYILLDWSRAFVGRDPNYPSIAVPHRVIPLMSLSETENWIQKKLQQIIQFKDAPEEDLPECTEEDLWRSEPVFKYYADENAPPGKRSTKNFDNLQEAMAFKSEKGKGRVDRIPGEVKACLYCPAFAACTQKDRLIQNGDLIIK